MEAISILLEEATSALQQCHDLSELRQLQVDFLGKKGKISLLLKTLGQCPPEDRQVRGQQINAAKQHVLALIHAKKTDLEATAIEAQIQSETVDITLAGRIQSPGGLHPVTRARMRIESYFHQLGFAIVEGPEIENEFYNFSALNIPETHPARAMHDTFYVDEKLLLRTHTSPTQIRYMRENTAPLRMIAPGRVIVVIRM